MEKLTLEINQQITLIEEAIAADKIPDFRPIQQKLEVFTDNLKNMDAAPARQYQDLLSAWSAEIKKSAEVLNKRIDEIRETLSSIQGQNKAIKGYNYLNQ